MSVDEDLPAPQRPRPRPRRMVLPEVSHLSPEDAKLLRALYIERNHVSYMELRKVQWAANRADG